MTELIYRSSSHTMPSTTSHTTTTSTTDSHILSNIYHGLAARSNPCGYPQPNPRTRRIVFPTSAHNGRPRSPLTNVHTVKQPSSSVPLNSLIPDKIPLKLELELSSTRCNASSTPRTLVVPTNDVKGTDSLTRERKGKMPALGHLLSVEQGKVLSLAADEKHVYAGCQSADNEITVSF